MLFISENKKKQQLKMETIKLSKTKFVAFLSFRDFFCKMTSKKNQ